MNLADQVKERISSAYLASIEAASPLNRAAARLLANQALPYIAGGQICVMRVCAKGVDLSFYPPKKGGT